MLNGGYEWHRGEKYTKIHQNFRSSCLWVVRVWLMSNLFIMIFTIFQVLCNKYVFYNQKKKSSPKKKEVISGKDLG